MVDESPSQGNEEIFGGAPMPAQPPAVPATAAPYGVAAPYPPAAQTPAGKGDPAPAAQTPAGKGDPIQVQSITVRTGRIAFDVQIVDERFRYTTPRLAAFASGQYPDLPHHACVNDVGDTFASVMERTSVAHLLEHLVISEQVRGKAAGTATFVGTTEWLNEGAGLARIEVGFKDDLVALRAFNEATRFLNMAVLTCLA